MYKMKPLDIRPLVFLLMVFPYVSICSESSEYWQHFGNNEKGQRFSPLTQINKENARNLTVAWKFHYGLWSTRHSHQVTPIMVNDGSCLGRDLLIFCTPWNDIVALNPVTGETVWNQTGARTVDINRYHPGPRTCRGLTTWVDPAKNDGHLCRRMIYMGTLSAFLVAVDAATGRFCPEFGEGGKMNLTVANATILRPDGSMHQIYGFISAPQVIGDTLVIGDSIQDDATTDKPIGQPRGFDCRTGAKKWHFFVIPQAEDDPAMGTWWNGTREVGGGNVWAPIGGDADEGIVYLATSSPHFDYWGGNRQGQNEYTDSIVALNATTGEKKWHYQIVKHDLWNYDLACQPVVTEIDVGGQKRKVILQLTKTGMLFVLDAEKGEPVFPVEEREVPKSLMPDDNAWPTQRFVVGELGNLTEQEIGPEDYFNPDGELDFVQPECRNNSNGRWRLPHQSGRMFTPHRTKVGNIQIPGDLGGGNWMSLAVHPEKKVAVMPVNNVLVVRELYRHNETEGRCWNRPMDGSPYVACYHRFFTGPPLQIPCIKPVWARLVAVDLNEGKIKWMKPFGSPLGWPLILEKEYGSRRVMGGTIITASDLVISTGGEDQTLYVYDLETGNELYSNMMDYDTTAVPMTYYTGGRQFIVVNSGGHWTSPLEKGDVLYAYALPESMTATTTEPTTTMKTTTPHKPVSKAASYPKDTGMFLFFTLAALFMTL